MAVARSSPTTSKAKATVARLSSGAGARSRPAAKPSASHCGLAGGDQDTAGLKKIHDARIGVEYRQSICIGHGDGMELEAFGDEVGAVQERSLPAPVAGL